ncbi:MAG: hypothetical protein CMJ75_22790 [Planctomycetaceae bacterium]|nr:hypothetical protein [Planctomycetaceae bacterium]
MLNIAYNEPKKITGATQQTKSIATDSTLVLAANSDRNYCLIQNTSDTDIFLNFAGSAATVAGGFKLVASTGSWESPGLVSLTSAIYAIHGGSGSKDLIVLEG